MAAEQGSLLDLSRGDQLCQIVFECVNETFYQMTRTNLRKGQVRVFDTEGSLINYKHDISGIIGVVQDDLEGTFSLSFSSETVFPILSEFYSKDIKKIDDRAIDSVAELTNVVYGLLKESLNDYGYGFKMCLPIVVMGPNHKVFSPLSATKWSQEIHTNHGTFWAELLFHNF